MNASDVEINKLPSVPGIILSLIEACHRPGISFDDLSQIIRQDVALTARIIAIGSSDTYTQWNEQRCFKSLLISLGIDSIKTIALTATVQQFFSKSREEEGREIGAIWQKALGCAYMARGLARLTGYNAPDEAYFAGLLHNLGQLVFLQKYRGQYSSVLKTIRSDQERYQREKVDFGVTATELGAYLLRHWIPDSFFSDAILFQREAAEDIFDSPPLIRLINLAHKLVEDDIDEADLLTEADRLFGLSEDALSGLKQEVQADLQVIRTHYGYAQDDSKPAVYDEKARRALGIHVRDAALAGCINEATIESSPWPLLLRDFSIIFDLSVIAAFEFDSTENALRGLRANGLHVDTHHLQQIKLPLKAGRNLLVEACLHQTILSTADDNLPEFASVPEEQLKRLLGKREMLALPLVMPGGLLLGGLIVGLSQKRLVSTLRKRSLLDEFLSAAVDRLKQHQYRLQEQTTLLEVQANNFHAQTRKMVHEANNPLGITKNYLQILAMNLDQGDEAQEHIAIIKEEIERVADILERMRNIGSEPQAMEISVDLNALVREIVTIFRMSLFVTHKITCELQLDDALPAINTERNSIKQILTNLLKNAVEALSTGGKIRVETNGGVNLNGMPHVQIVVADNGPGIPRPVLDCIFSPVVSTKAPPHAGIGLVIVKNLVTELKGNIFVHSAEEEGTRFEILLPRDRPDV